MKRILLLFLLFCGGYVHAQELDSARIHYRQGHRNVDVLFRDNRTELERFIRILREEHGTGRLENVVIRSWASPDGANRLNEVLSKRRADSLKAYLVRHAGIPDSIVSMHGEGIAWDMLRRMVAASDMLYKKRYCTSSITRRYGCSMNPDAWWTDERNSSWSCAADGLTCTCRRTSSRICVPVSRWPATGNRNRP